MRLVHAYLLTATPEQRRRYFEGASKLLLAMAAAQQEWIEVDRAMAACRRTDWQTFVAWLRGTP